MKYNKGTTLLELLVVVGIGAVISLSVLWAFYSTNHSIKVQGEADFATDVIKRVDMMFTSESPVGITANNNSLKGMGILKPYRKSMSGSAIPSMWEDNGFVLTANVTQIDLLVRQVHEGDCFDFSSYFLNPADSLIINGTQATTLNEVVLECDNNDDDDILIRRVRYH